MESCLLSRKQPRHWTSHYVRAQVDGCAAAGDWLQGPYVYALYQYYGFDRGQIGRLFIGGFASSMIFGTFAGSLTDR